MLVQTLRTHRWVVSGAENPPSGPSCKVHCTYNMFIH